MHMTCPQNQSKACQWCFVSGSEFPWTDAVEVYPWGEVAWSGDLLGLLILTNEGKGEWNLEVTHSVWQQVPKLQFLQGKRAGKRLWVQIHRKAGFVILAEYIIRVHLTWTRRTKGSGFSDLFVRASSTVLICSFTHTRRIKIWSMHFSLTCFWQSDKQVKNRVSS